MVLAESKNRLEEELKKLPRLRDHEDYSVSEESINSDWDFATNLANLGNSDDFPIANIERKCGVTYNDVRVIGRGNLVLRDEIRDAVYYVRKWKDSSNYRFVRPISVEGIKSFEIINPQI